MVKSIEKNRCPSCQKNFKQLKRHFSKNPICKQFVLKETLEKKKLYRKNINGHGEFTRKGKASMRDEEENLQIQTYTTSVNEDDDVYFTFNPEIDNEDEDLINKKMQYVQNRNDHLPSSTIASIKLLKILQKINAPLYTYESIMEWSAECSNLGIMFSHNYPTRENIIKKLSTELCMTGMLPKESPLKLADDRIIKVTHFDFKEMCFSILNDGDLMKDENLTFANINPCAYVRSAHQKQYLTCIEDGSLYQNTAQQICVKNNDFCLGVKLFIDATHTDIHGNWMLDPVMFTFTFFNNDVANNDKAWRPLGFITEFGQHKIKNHKSITNAEKLQDFHYQLEIILSSLRDCQKNCGFLWDLKHKNKTFRVNMKPVVLLVVGDAQGNHKLAGMYGKFTEVNRVNHSCNCPWTETDNEKFKCNFVKQCDIKELCLNNDTNGLNFLSQHNIENAFDSIVTGCHPAGINALMPSEILHQMFLGLMEYALKAFFGEFGNMSLRKIDNYGKEMFTRFQHNSDRSIPIRYFRDGFTKMTKQKGSDKIGLSVIVICCMYSKYKDIIIEGCRVGPTTKKIESYVFIIERLIILAEWLCQDKFEVNCLAQVHHNIVLLMKFYKQNVRRDSIHGMRISKFHELLHIIRDIHLFGPPKGYDGRPGESSHKQTKQLAQRTQKRTDYFEMQTGKRIFESLVINKAFDDIVKEDVRRSSNLFPCLLSLNKKHTTSSVMYFTEEDVISHPLINNITMGSNVFQESCKFVLQKIGNLFKCGQVPILPYIKTENEIQIHSHPLYKLKEEWFDWVLIKWEYKNSNFEYVPARVMQIIDMTNVSLHINNPYYPGVYICIISLKTTTRKVTKSKIISKGTYERCPKQNLVFRIIDLKSIYSNCFAIPDSRDLDMKVISDCDEWLFVERRIMWSKHIES